jgi:hypothetical protein
MMERTKEKKKRLVKTVKQLTDKDNYRFMPDNSFRDFWSRQTHKGRIELIATVVAGFAAALIVFYLLLR